MDHIQHPASEPAHSADILPFRRPDRGPAPSAPTPPQADPAPIDNGDDDGPSAA